MNSNFSFIILLFNKRSVGKILLDFFLYSLISIKIKRKGLFLFNFQNSLII